jgi:predicted Fe-Mo cluster-binding NifX family protein
LVSGRSEIIVCVPVTVEGLLDPRWGRADRVAVATVSQDGIDDWKEFDVGWGSLHDAGTEGSHHARIARFLREHGVEAVAAHHMGAGMTHMLEKMGLTVRLGETGSAREAAARVLGGERDTERRSTPR